MTWCENLDVHLLSHRTNMNFVETSSYMTQHSLFTITYIRDFPMMTQYGLFTITFIRDFPMMLKIEKCEGTLLLTQ